MERLSSSGTRSLKLGVPAVTFAVLIGTAAYGVRGGPAGTAIPLLFILGFATLLVTLLFSALLGKLADEVIDHGAFLVVRKGSRSTNIDIAQITNVGYSTLATPRTVWLRIASNTAFGREVSFIPRSAPFGFEIPRVVTELRTRVNALQSVAGDA